MYQNNNDIHECDAMFHHGAAPFISSGRTHSESSRVPRDSKIGTDFRKTALCAIVPNFKLLALIIKKVIRGVAGPTQSEPTIHQQELEVS